MITAIIPSYNRPEIIVSLVLNILSQSYFQKEEGEIIISVDESDTQIGQYRNLINQIKLIAKNINPRISIDLLVNETKGIVPAKNNAVKKAKYNLIMMFDDDLIPEHDYIEKLATDLIKDSSVGAVSGYIVSYEPAISHTQPSDKLTSIPTENTLQILNIIHEKEGWRSAFGKKEQVMDWSTINDRIDINKRFEVDYFVNSYMFTRESYEKTRGYNISLNSKTAAHEEVDFTYRIGKSGYKLILNPFARMWHLTVKRGGIYKGETFEESKSILEKEYNDSIVTFIESIKKGLKSE